MQSEDIKKLIEAGLPNSHVEIEGDDGTHFAGLIVSEEFAGKSMVQQHQLVYGTLGEKMGTDIHALSIQTYTPEEWEEKKKLRVV